MSNSKESLGYRTDRQLLTSNAKLDKGGRTDGYLVRGLALAPHVRSGVNFCEDAGLCAAVCNLWFAGRTVSGTYRTAAIERSHWLLNDSISFHEKLHRELNSLASLADRLGLEPLVRLNVASDLEWFDVIAAHPEITFYDYTKVASRIERNKLPNYHLTYSVSERSDLDFVNSILADGRNVSLIVDTDYHPQSGKIGELPDVAVFGSKQWPIIDGDLRDYRVPAYDGFGNVVGLRFKGGRNNKLYERSIADGLVYVTV